MNSAKLIGLLGVAFASLPLFGQPATPCETPPNQATNRPVYSAQVKHVDGPGLLPADFAYITFGTNKFGFVIPVGFHLETESAQEVTLVSANLGSLMTFRVLEALPPGAPELDSAWYRDLLMSRRPGAKITEEFSQTAINRSGPAFELHWKAAGKVPRRERVLFIASDAGVLEFCLSSSPEEFEAHRPTFCTLLLTFRAADESGQLRMPMLSNRL